MKRVCRALGKAALITALCLAVLNMAIALGERMGGKAFETTGDPIVVMVWTTAIGAVLLLLGRR